MSLRDELVHPDCTCHSPMVENPDCHGYRCPVYQKRINRQNCTCGIPQEKREVFHLTTCPVWKGRKKRPWANCSCNQQNVQDPNEHAAYCQVWKWAQPCTCGKTDGKNASWCNQHSTVTQVSSSSYTYTNQSTYTHPLSNFKKENDMFRTTTVRTIDGVVGQVTYSNGGPHALIVWQSEPVKEGKFNDDGDVIATPVQLAEDLAQAKIDEVVADLFKDKKASKR